MYYFIDDERLVYLVCFSKNPSGHTKEFLEN